MFALANQVFQTNIFQGEIVYFGTRRVIYKKEKEWESICRRKQMFPCPSLSSKCLFIIFLKGPIKPSNKYEAEFQNVPASQNSKMVRGMISYYTLFVHGLCTLTSETVIALDAKTGASSKSPQCKFSASSNLEQEKTFWIKLPRDNVCESTLKAEKLI